MVIRRLDIMILPAAHLERLETFAGIHKVQDLRVNFDDFGNLVDRINRGKGRKCLTAARRLKTLLSVYLRWLESLTRNPP